MQPNSRRDAAAQATRFQRRRRQLKYRGVRKRSWGRWVAEIRVPKSCERLWLGSYSNPYQAARAYDVAAVCLRGPAAARNLPNHAVPQPGACLSPASIRAFAAQEAARFSPLEEQQAGTSIAPLASDKYTLQEQQPSSISDHRVNCSLVNPLDYNLAWVTEQLDKHRISATELQSFQDGGPAELNHTTHLSSQVAPLASERQNAQMQQLDCEETHARDQPLGGPQSLLELWFGLDISPAVHPSLKALLSHSLYPDNNQE